MEYNEDADEYPQSECWEAVGVVGTTMIFVYCLN